MPEGEDQHRPLGAVERLFWLLDQNRPTHFCMVAELEGEIIASELEEALRILSSDNPLLTARIASDALGVVTFLASGLGLAPIVLPAGTDWIDVAASELDLRFDPATGPLFRLSLVPVAGRHVLVATAHHSIADGMSCAMLLKDLIWILAGRPPRGRRLAASLESRVGSPPAPTGPAVTAPPTGTALPYRPAGQPTAVAVLKLDRDETGRLLETARAERASVHGALCAALAEAYAGSGRPVDAGTRLLTPIDVRRRLFEGDGGLAMYVNAIAVGVAEAALPFWERARVFSSRHEAMRSVEGVTAGVLAVDSAMQGVTSVDHAAAVWAQVFGAELLLSNLGDLGPSEHVGPLRLVSLWGPAVSMGLLGEQTIGAGTFDDRLHLLHASAQPVRGLLEGMVAALRRATVQEYAA